jgi:hypothetical protein
VSNNVTFSGSVLLLVSLFGIVWGARTGWISVGLLVLGSRRYNIAGLIKSPSGIDDQCGILRQLLIVELVVVSGEDQAVVALDAFLA